MKNRILLFFATAILCSCSNDVTSPIKDAKADFLYSNTKWSKIVTFYNNSSDGLYVHSWEYGDGSTELYPKEHVTHSYSSTGAKSVKLVCKDRNGYFYETTKTVHVGAGTAINNGEQVYTKVYLYGFKLYETSASLSQFYCRFELVAHGVLVPDNIIKTEYSESALTKSNLPYFMENGNMLIGDFPDMIDWYDSFTLRVYLATDKTTDGECILEKELTPDNLAALNEVIVFDSTTSTKIGLLLEYK